MGAIVCLFFGGFMVFAFILAMSGGSQNANWNQSSAFGGGGFGGFGGFGSLAQNGTPARAIMLWVSNTGSSTRRGNQRFEIRNARVDVEMAGYPPFELTTNVYIPSNLVRDVLPGSTMEIRMSQNDRSMVLVVGPDVGYAQGAVRTS
jgi:hypothetical protein